MAIDRNESLRRAEKLLRQGRLDGAIEEYERLLEDQPADWNTRNVLGDLYVRAGQAERAVAHITRIADHFAQEGFLPRAIALYKKVVKIKPDDEHALLQSAEIAVKQGLLVDAKACLAAIADQRQRRGDAPGASAILLRIAALDPSDLSARVNAARAAVGAGDAPAAAAGYRDVALELLAKGRVEEAIQALTEAVALAPADVEARDHLVAAHLQRDDLESARRHALTSRQLKAIADELARRGRDDEALDALFDVVERDPGDGETRAHLVRRLIARGEVERAATCLGPDGLAGDPDLLLLFAEAHLRNGRAEAARDLLKPALDRDPGRRSHVLALGVRLVESSPLAAFECVDLATDAAIGDHDYQAAADALREFVRRVPGHVPALVKLVDVCVDGEMEGPLREVQASLADTYLDRGRAQEARVIAEDLFVRAPADPAAARRFRRALEMAGEADPDAIIADRQSAAATMDAANLGLAAEREGALQPAAPAASEPADAPDSSFQERGAAEPPPAQPAPSAGPAPAPSTTYPVASGPLPTSPASTVDAAAGKRPDGEAASTPPKPSVYELSPGAIDLSHLFAEDEADLEGPGREGEALEIDLSGELTSLKPGQTRPPGPSAGGPGGSPLATAPVESIEPDASTRDLDAVFAEFRQEVQREQAGSSAAQHYKVALTYYDMGMLDEAVKVLESTVRAPQYRFLAASLLGRLHRQQGRTQQAIDWFERAAETPAPDPGAGRALLYELGQALEDAGEDVRALAVYLELQADAGRYRDVAARVGRLSQRHKGD